MEFDRRAFFTTLGGTAAVGLMSDEARADALEDYMMSALDSAVDDQQSGGGAAEPEATKFPTRAEVEAQIETRPVRRGVGSIFAGGHGNVKRLPPMPEKPTLLDFYNLRFNGVANHVLQSANRALKTGMTEEVVFACLLHDVVQTLIKVDHGWWGAQMFEPYVSEKVTFAIRYHQALRFYEDPANGYEYPDLYRTTFGSDYKPGKLQYREGSVYGNPFLRFLRREVEALVSAEHGAGYLKDRQAKTELARINRELKRRRNEIAALEESKAKLLAGV